MDNIEYADSGLSKKRHRQEKRFLKQVGNQQKRTREKAALKDILEGDQEFIPDFRIDKPSCHWNGFDYIKED